MLHSYRLEGFGRTHFGQAAAPSLLDLIRSQMRQPAAPAGLGALVADWSAFVAGGRTATYVDPEKRVYCNKDSANRPQCWENKPGEQGHAIIRSLQQTVDGLINQIPIRDLVGKTLVAQVPAGDGTTREKQFTIPPLTPNPIGAGRGGGYDGYVGDTTMLFATTAMTIAGMLKAFPNPEVTLVFVTMPERNDILARHAEAVNGYLRDVTENFDTLLQAYFDRGKVPVQTQLDVETIPFVEEKPKMARRNTAAIVGVALLLLGVAAGGGYMAARGKQDEDDGGADDGAGMLPTLGRRGRGRHGLGRRGYRAW